jgi:hypothetical protein
MEDKMKSFQNANQISGRAIGSLFFAGFGALWIVLAFYALERLNFATIFGIACITLGLILAAVSLIRQSKCWPRVPEDPKVTKAFKIINGIQYLAIGAIVVACNVFHLLPYLMCAITLVVGLHMFPLARIFKYPPHYVAGAALVAWAIISALVLPLEHMQGISALGTGLLLWLSAAFTLCLTLSGTRQVLGSPAQ